MLSSLSLTGASHPRETVASHPRETVPIGAACCPVRASLPLPNLQLVSCPLAGTHLDVKHQSVPPVGLRAIPLRGNSGLI